MKLFAVIITATVPFSVMAASIDIEPIPDLPLNNVPSASATEKAQSTNVWKFSLGGGLSYAPRYEGAASNRLLFMPLLEANYNNGEIFISPLRGVGYNFSGDRTMQYGVRLAPDRIRYQSDDPRLNGMGDLRFTPQAGLFFNKRFSAWYISSGINTGIHGTNAELGSGFFFPVSAVDRVRFGVNLNWGDTKYNQTYFGVTTGQAAASGNVLTAYGASAGLMDYAVTTNWLHNYDRKWFSNAGLSYKWLGTSAQQSPLTQRSSMASGNFLVGYRF